MVVEATNRKDYCLRVRGVGDKVAHQAGAPFNAATLKPARHPTFGSNSLPFNNHERVSAFLSAGARVLVGLQGAIVTVSP
jgi:hypothetical protein